MAVQKSGETSEAERAAAGEPPLLVTRTPASPWSGLWLSLGFAGALSLLSGLSFQQRAVLGLGPQQLLGQAVLHFLLALALCSYLRRFGQPRLRLLRTQLGILGTMVLVYAGALGLLHGLGLSPWWLPVTVAPLWTAMSFDRRAGFLLAVVMTFLLGALVGLQGIVLCVLLARGTAATLVYLDRRSSRHFLVAGTWAGATSVLVLVAASALVGEPWGFGGEPAELLSSAPVASLGAGILEGVLAALLRPLAERVLGHVSRDRLLQLTDLEQPLLQRLAREAPGTFEHSRAMANLAEQAASAIGADALLTRVGAYYHDLGKTVGAKHFVENLDSGEVSPHDALSPEESARRIVRHVVEGTRILREGGIPEPVVEFAYTHHGTQLIEYFCNKYRQKQAEQGLAAELDTSHFRYPGMKPQTKETAILMLVDSIEAASRTIDPPDRVRFQQMVQRIVQTKLEQGQLDGCNLSLAELRIIQTRMVETLVHMHHHRIKYPWQAERAEQFGVPASVVARVGDEKGASGQQPAESSATVVSIGRGARQ